MKHRKLQIILISTFILLTISTVAYAYAGPTLGLRVIKYVMTGGDARDLQTGRGSNGDQVGPADGIIPRSSNPSTPSFGSPPAPTTKPLKQILSEHNITGAIPNLQIVVDKPAHILTLYSGVTPLKTYRISLGDGGLGDKVKAGDHKTPEGRFYISERSILTPTDKFLGTRWMRVSYPNKEDADRGLATGLIDRATRDRIYTAINNKQTPPQNTALGGGVGIHGGRDNNGTKDWTWGCMGLSTADVNEMFDYIDVGTSLYIHN